MISDKRLGQILEGLELEASELEAAAQIAAQHGMYESGSALRQKASGIRRTIETLTVHKAL